MRIIGIETTILRIPQIAATNDSAQDAAVITVSTDAGIVGYGEVDSSPEIVRAIVDAPRSHRLCTGLANVLIGADPLDTEGLWEAMYRASVWYGRRGVAIQAMSGIDIALWDIRGKAYGRPVYQLLGQPHRREIPAYASQLMPERSEEVARVVAQRRDEGFRAVKLGWGPLAVDLDADVERVRAAREAAGPDVELMIDLGYYPGPHLGDGWDAAVVLEFCRRIEAYGIRWLEEFLPPDDLTGYAQVAAGTSIPTAAGENCTTRHDILELIECGRVSIVQPDVARSGGLTECLRIAGLAAERGRVCAPHTFSTGLNTAAAMHLVCAIPNAQYLEYAISDSPLCTDLFTKAVQVEDGLARVPEVPGIGVSPNEEVLRRYAI